MSKHFSSYPHWLSSTPSEEARQLSEKKTLNSALAKETPPAKGELVKAFAYQWFSFSKEIIQNIFDIWSPNFDQKMLLEELKSYVSEMLEASLVAMKSQKKISRDLVRKIENFKTKNNHFSSYIDCVSTDLSGDFEKLISLIKDLINESNYFINNFDATRTMIWANRKFSHRPTNIEKKLGFMKIVSSFYKDNGKFPPFKSRELTHLNLSERTWRHWKKQIENETFHHFIQHKNRQ